MTSDALRAALTQVGIDGASLAVWRQTPTVVLHAVPVAAEEAIDAWRRARRYVEAWGHYPVVVDDTEGEFRGDLDGSELGPREILAAAAEVEAAAWFRAQIEAEAEDDDPVPLGAWETGAWGKVERQHGFTVPHDYQGKPRPGLHLVFVPTTAPWQAVAWLGFGGWNACPATEVHVAVHRRWYHAYGAEVVCIGRDVIEMRVARPVKDRVSALALAREQFHYSGGDLVYQGYGALRPLATSLIDADRWHFWWD